MSALGMPKDLESEARKLRKLGWVIELTRSNHVRWTSPRGWTTISGLTPNNGGVRQVLHAVRKEQRSIERPNQEEK